MLYPILSARWVSWGKVEISLRIWVRFRNSSNLTMLKKEIKNNGVVLLVFYNYITQTTSNKIYSTYLYFLIIVAIYGISCFFNLRNFPSKSNDICTYSTEKGEMVHLVSSELCIPKFCYLSNENPDVCKVLFNLLLLTFLINCKLSILKNCL